MSVSNILSLKEQLVQYGSHHNNKVNVGIHMVFVPTIFWTSLVFTSKTGPLINPSSLPSTFGWLSKFGPSLSFFVVGGYSLYYTLLDPVASALYAPILYGMAYTANKFYLTHPNAIKIALGIHVVAWTFQFIGHGVAEKRRPKLMDNLVQALVSAPYFVFFEVLFAVGYRPQLYREVRALVEKDIAEFRAKKAK